MKAAAGRDAATRQRNKDIIKEFIGQFLEGSMTVSRDTEAMINARIAQIDHLVSIQLNEVMHHPDFQKLEASWRGLKMLMDRSETGTQLKIKVLNVNKRELLRDLQRAAEFDQSAAFKKVYEEEFGVFGGSPFAALVGDYEFSSTRKISSCSRRCLRWRPRRTRRSLPRHPRICSIWTATLRWTLPGLAKIFDTNEYAKWKSFRNSEDSRYVALTCPHVLMRLPYGRDGVQIDDFAYEEQVDGTDHNKYLWGNAAYALATRLTNAFAQYGWCAAIRGVEGGGLVESLPIHTFRTEDGDIAMKCPTEVAITDRREKELADNGFVPLVHSKGTDYAAFFSVQSAQKPKLYDKEAANANARLSTQLPYLLAMCRFAHYLKSMMRDKIGSFMSRSDCELFLNRWIANYVVLDDNAPASVKASKPLREARVEVMEVPGKPGAYRAVSFLRPHFQLDELTVSLRLVADLPPPAKG